MAAGMLPLTSLVTHFGERRCLATMLVVWALLAVANSFIVNFWQLLLLRLLFGASESAAMMAVLLHVSRWFPPDVYASAVSVVTGIQTFGSTFGGFFSSRLMIGLDGVWGFSGWRWMILVEGLLALPVALWTHCALSESAANAGSWLPAPDRAALSAHQKSLSFQPLLPSLRTLCGRASTVVWTVWFFTFYGFAHVLQFFAPSFITGYFSVRGWHRHDILTFMGVTVSSIGLLIIPTAFYSARWAETRPKLANGIAMTFVVGWALPAASALLLTISGLLMLVAAPMDPEPPWMGFGVFVILPSILLMATSQAHFWGLHNAAQPAELRPASLALATACGYLGGFVGPSMLGAFVDYAGPHCPPGVSVCAAEYGWGFVVIGVLACVLVAGTGVLAVKLGIATVGRDSESGRPGQPVKLASDSTAL